MIKFKKLRFKNFLATGNQFTEIDLDKEKTTLIIGTNGAGKSTIIDAFSFVNYNKAFRKITKPQLVNSVTKKNCVVEEEFEIGSNQYKVIRGIKPDIFEVYRDGVLINQETDKYQELFEKNILKATHKSFCQMVILANGSYTEFMTLKTPERRKFIEDILDLNVFSSMNILLKDKTRENEETIRDLEKNKVSLEEKIKLVQVHIKELEQNNDDLISEKESIFFDIENELDLLYNEEAEIIELLAGLNTELQAKKEIEDDIHTLQIYQGDIKTVNLIHIERDINFLNRNDNCPTCKQKIDEEFKQKELKSKTALYNEHIEAFDKAGVDIEELKKELEPFLEVEDTIATLKTKLAVIRGKFSPLNKQRDMLSSEIKALEAKKAQVKQDDRLAQYEQELEACIDNYSKELEQRKVYQVAGQLLKDTGIKAQIIKQYVPIINKTINDYLTKMEFFVKFTLDENFDETIHSNYRNNFSYESFSNGEKFRLNLAIFFTWVKISKMRNSINTNMLFLDEIMDGPLDYIGKNGFFNIVDQIYKDTNIFVISHNFDSISDHFDRVLVFEKIKNFSRLKENDEN